MLRSRVRDLGLALSVCLIAAGASAQSRGSIAGRVLDETGGALPGVTVELRSAAGGAGTPTVTNGTGDYSFDNLSAGTYEVAFALINFGSMTRRDVRVQTGVTRVDAVMQLSLSA